MFVMRERAYEMSMRINNLENIKYEKKLPHTKLKIQRYSTSLLFTPWYLIPNSTSPIPIHPRSPPPAPPTPLPPFKPHHPRHTKNRPHNRQRRNPINPKRTPTRSIFPTHTKKRTSIRQRNKNQPNKRKRFRILRFAYRETCFV